MSVQMRAVKETWFADTGLFVLHDEAIAVLDHLATACGTTSSESEYGDKTSYWIQDGARFLDYIATSDLNVAAITEQIAQSGAEPDPVELASFLGNLFALEREWREAIDPKDQSLRFYID